MLLYIFLLVGVVAAGAAVAKLSWGAHFVNALADGRVGPSLLDRMNELLEPYEGVQLDEDELRTLEARASAHFVDILANDGFVVRSWQVLIRNDEVLGPRCFLKSSAGEELSLADFTLRLRQGRIDVESG